MTEREVAAVLKRYAKKHKFMIVEDIYENVCYEHLFPQGSIVIGWDGEKRETVQFLASTACTVNPPEEIFQLHNLKKVHIYANGQDLSWLGRLEGIECMEIYNWSDERLPDSWACSDTMKSLYLETCKGTVPNQLQCFRNLTQIGLDSFNNAVLDLPEWLGSFTKLKKVSLKRCQIRSIPYSLVQLRLPFHIKGSHRDGILLNGAELKEENIELFTQPQKEIDAYYRRYHALHAGDKIEKVRECKVIFLGDGSVGKTSLIDRITCPEKTFSTGTLPTDGVKMVKWKTEIEGEEFTIRFLDFGGQEIMHSMHRCFLTTHTVYVVVCDSRDDAEVDISAARWVETVNTFAEGSPVIVALNKADLNPSAAVNEVALKSRNPNIVRILNTSALTELNLEVLKEEILRYAPSCVENYRSSADWLGVKRELEDMMSPEVHYITDQQYRDICKNHGIENESMLQDMLTWFKELGVAYSYDPDEKDNSVQGIRVLDPEWLTNGIYRLILRTPQGGFLNIVEIEEDMAVSYPGDIKEYEYTKNETQFVLYVMRKFEISHPLNDGTEMIPAKMEKTPPHLINEFPVKGSVHLRWSGHYLPNNLVHRFIIRRHEDLLDRAHPDYCVWRTGGWFRCQTGNADALVQMDDRYLDIYVNSMTAGKESLGQVVHLSKSSPVIVDFTDSHRRYLGELRAEIKSILASMNLKVAEMICYTIDGTEGQVQYEDAMLHYLQHREIFIPGCKAWTNPENLLKTTYPNLEEEAEEYRMTESYHTETVSAMSRYSSGHRNLKGLRRFSTKDTAVSSLRGIVNLLMHTAWGLMSVVSAGIVSWALVASANASKYGESLLELAYTLGGLSALVLFTGLIGFAMSFFWLNGRMRRIYGVACCSPIEKRAWIDAQAAARRDSGKNIEGQLWK